MSLNNPVASHLRKYFGASVLVMAALGIATATQFGDKSPAFLQSYLMGWLFWMLLAIGCLGLVLLHHTIRPTWSLSTLRLYEAGGSWVSFVMLGLAGLPIFLNLGKLYEWTHAEFMASSLTLQYKTWYLNLPFFTGRQIFYFAFWIAVAYLFRRSSLKQDETLNPRGAQLRSGVAAVLLPFFVIFLTFATTDWIMSLDVHWFSAIFAVWLMIGGVLTAIALTNLIVLRNRDKDPYRDIMSKGLTKDLGNMMFVFTLLWAYTSISQFLIIWQGNLSEFIGFYVHRSHGGWEVLSIVLIVGHFFVPFIALMSPKVKAVPALLAGMCIWILAMRLIDFFWIMAPFFRPEKVALNALPDILCFAAVGAVWATAFLYQLTQARLIPAHDDRLQEAYHHA